MIAYLALNRVQQNLTYYNVTNNTNLKEKDMCHFCNLTVRLWWTSELGFDVWRIQVIMGGKNKKDFI